MVDATGTIACVGCGCAERDPAATKIICPDAVISPGLVDAHEHIGWLGDEPWAAAEHGVDPALRWEQRNDWLRGRDGYPKIEHGGGEATGDEKSWGELRLLLGGATSIFGSGDLTGLLRDLDWTGSGRSGLGQVGARYDTFPLGDQDGREQESGCDRFRIRDEVSDFFDAYVPHVAEGINEAAHNELLCMIGQGYGAQPILDSRAAIIHGVALTAADAAQMASAGMRLIWSPRSNLALYGNTAPVTLLHRLGIDIGLGTDWIVTGSMNMLRELRCADSFNQEHLGGYFSDDQLWLMATYGSARALAFDAVIGVLAPGRAADVAVFANHGRRHHRAVLGAGVGEVALVMRGGQVVAGNAPVVAALEGDCDSLGEVCGVEKRVCLQRDVGKSWGELQAALGPPPYPLFFCSEPENEPTCLPARTRPEDAVNQSTSYPQISLAADRDGDGVVDAEDNCPEVFNPIRPLDWGAQADLDQDSVGDVCDRCPMDADDRCPDASGWDLDQDGSTNWADNCPSVSNPEQWDADEDGKGDACDLCPGFANPGARGCLVEVAEVKTNPGLMGQRIALWDIIVTALGPKGCFLQKNTSVPPDHGAVFAYLGSDPKPARGTLVDVDGATVTSFYGQVQISKVMLTPRGTAAEPQPRLLDAEAVRKMVAVDRFASPHEAMVIQVRDLTVVDENPPGGPADWHNHHELEVTGGLRVDDGLWDSGTFLGRSAAEGDLLRSVTGPVSFRNDYLKLLPRDAADVVW